MKARTALPALTLGVLLLTGCTSPAAEPPGLTASPTSTPTSSPTPEPSPTDGIQVSSDTEAGIVFDDVPDLTGDEAEVYNWIATYQKAFWETLRTNEVSATFAAFTSTEIQDTMARIASDNAEGRAGRWHLPQSDLVTSPSRGQRHGREVRRPP